MKLGEWQGSHIEQQRYSYLKNRPEMTNMDLGIYHRKDPKLCICVIDSIDFTNDNNEDNTVKESSFLWTLNRGIVYDSFFL